MLNVVGIGLVSEGLFTMPMSQWEFHIADRYHGKPADHVSFKVTGVSAASRIVMFAPKYTQLQRAFLSYHGDT